MKDENSILPVSSLIENYYGISDLYLSLPVIINHKGVRDLIRLELNVSEKKALKKSAQTIKRVLEKLELNI